jgi:hypothetical protein
LAVLTGRAAGGAPLEYHPELAGTRYTVELGLAGKEDLARRGWTP